MMLATRLLAAETGSTTNAVVSTPPVYVPDTTHQNDPLPDGVLAWDGLMKETNATEGAFTVHFVVNFTNVSPNKVAILNVHASCGCTQPELPPLPWLLAPDQTGQFGVTVNITGKTGMLFKTITVTTDKGSKTIMLKINVLPMVMPKLSEADRARNIIAAKADRQAVFRGDCATCHVKPGEGKYGMALYEADCAICHEGKDRATMVPDLHALKTPTNEEFWRTWIAHGKPNSLMPAFSTGDGGPLSDIQIASLASYLNATIPSHVPANH